MKGEHEGWVREWPKEDGYYWIDFDDHDFKVVFLEVEGHNTAVFYIPGGREDGWNPNDRMPLWWPHRLEHPSA